LGVGKSIELSIELMIIGFVRTPSLEEVNFLTIHNFFLKVLE
jgi:hypothetical protein